MTKTTEHALREMSTRNIREATDEELKQLKEMSDDNLLRASTSLDLFAVVESNRRLRVAIHKEEKAIKWLTWVLVGLTFALVVLTAILVWPSWPEKLLKHLW